MRHATWEEIGATFGAAAAKSAKRICETEGFEPAIIPVVRFTDHNDTRRWFYRNFDKVGEILALRDGHILLDKTAVHQAAVNSFGPDVDLIY